MQVNKQPARILARTAAVLARSRLYRILPRHLRGVFLKVWHFVAGSRLLSNIPFSFNVEVNGTRFQLRGPFRYIVNEYYVPYVAESAYEVHVTAHIAQVVRQCPTPRVLDVGAHYGWYTIYLAKLTANRGTVFAIEPSEAIFSLLKRNVELNGLRNVRLYKLPLSDKRETISMVASKSHPRESRYMHSVTEQGATANYTDTLSAIPFDELNEMEAIHPNIVKIDVHSVWGKVIDGMRESLRRDVEHLYLELDNISKALSSQYANIQHVIFMLRDVGMDVYEIQGFRKRDGGKMIKVDENWIARRQDTLSVEIMLYAVKRR